nr:hypothetical protein [Nitrososphaerota archaeon]
LVRILELDGPNLDSSKNGILVATFTIKAQVLLPWGTTFSNPFRQTGIVLRDLNGVGMEYMLNPLEFACNFTINNPNTSSENFSWEFIVDNQNAFTSATSLQLATCTALSSGTASQTNPVATNPSFGDSAFDSMTIDNVNYPEALGGSLKGTKSGPAGAVSLGFGYNLGSSGINLSTYDRIRIWFRCDQVGQNYYAVLISDTSGRRRWWNFPLQAANAWMNVEVAIASYSNQDSGFSISAVQYVGAHVQTASSAPSSINVWIGDLRAEVGYINHCFDTSAWTAQNGSGLAFANDTTISKSSPQLASYSPENWNASMKCAGTSASDGFLGAYYTMSSSAWNFSSYDFLVLWVRADFGGNPSGSIYISMGDTTFTNYYQWRYASLLANQFYRLSIPLRNTATQGGSPALGSMAALLIQAIGANSVASNFWVTEIAADIGDWVNLEMMIPDNVSQSIIPSENAIQVASWNGSSYSIYEYSDALGGSGANNVYNLFGLDGIAFGNIYSGQNNGICVPNTINQTSMINTHVSSGNGNVQLQPIWGTNTRFVIQLKMPPATSDSNTGSYPSDDIAGFQAINKARLRLIVNVSNENTTYIGN